MTKLYKLDVLAAGYVVVVVYVAAMACLLWLEPLLREKFKLAAFSPSLLAAMAAILAAPVLLALLWSRITKVKVFDVEIALNEVSLPTTDRLAVDVREMQSESMGPSAKPEIVARIKRAVRDVVSTEILQVDLGKGEEWWVTRLYLLAGLTADYTSIRSFVFLATEVKGDRRVAGIGSPIGVQKALGQAFPYVAKAYSTSKGLALQSSEADEIETVVQQFGTSLTMVKPERFKADEAALLQPGVKEFVTPALAKRLFPPDASMVEWEGGPETPLLRYRIIDRASPLVCIVVKGRLEKIVDRCELAARVAKSALGELVSTS